MALFAPQGVQSPYGSPLPQPSVQQPTQRQAQQGLGSPPMNPQPTSLGGAFQSPQQPPATFGPAQQQPQSAFGQPPQPSQAAFGQAQPQPGAAFGGGNPQPADMASMYSMLQSIQQLQSLLAQPGTVNHPAPAAFMPPPAAAPAPDNRPLEERYQVLPLDLNLYSNMSRIN